jgi:hypothetical protein
VRLANDGTGSKSYPRMGFDISGDESGILLQKC